MKRKIITYGGYFETFIEKLSEKVLRKLDYIIIIAGDRRQVADQVHKIPT